MGYVLLGSMEEKSMKKKLIRITTVPESLKVLLADQLKFINNYFEVIGVSSEGKELKDVKAKAGIKTVSLNMSREITPFRDLLSLVKITLDDFFKGCEKK